MNIANDLKSMYEHYLVLATREVEKTLVSPEIIITLIERISDLENDIKNIHSYVHADCRTVIELQRTKIEELKNYVRS